MPFFLSCLLLKNSDEIFNVSVLKLEQDTLHCNLVSKTKVFFFQMIIDFTGIFLHTNTNNYYHTNKTYITYITTPNFWFRLSPTLLTIYSFSIITQVIIEILALSLAENGVIFRFIQ